MPFSVPPAGSAALSTLSPSPADAAHAPTEASRMTPGERRASVPLTRLETLWLNTGTLCNLACATCYIESSPTNDALVYLSASDAARFLDEAQAMGTREIGFTGGVGIADNWEGDASKPDHWGIPGLLWIEQGCAQELHASVAHAADHLRGALGGQTDELASSLGDAVLERVAARRAELYQLLKDLGAVIETAAAPSAEALILVAPLGLDVTTLAAVERLDATRTVGIDMMLEDAAVKRRVLATNPATRPDMRDAAHALFARDGKAVSVIRDSGGFVSQRVAATIVNIAADICQQGICTPADLELAVTLGLGYPMGPLALGDRIGPTNVLEILFNLQTVYGDPRYRPSPWLRRRGALGLSLKHEEA